MKRVWALFAALAAVLAAPAAAQDSENDTVIDSPADDLSCAMILSAIMERMGEAATNEDRYGLLNGIVYFIGRWEAASPGANLTTAMAEHYPIFAAQEPSQLAVNCGRRVQDLGTRMEAAGSAITAIQDKLQSDPHSPER